MAQDTDNTSSTFDIGSMVAEAAEKVDFSREDESVPEIKEETDNTNLPDEEEETSEVNEPSDDETQEQEPVVQTRQAPKSWAKEQHEVWNGLPDAAKDYIETREKQMLDGIEEYKEYAGFGRELNNVIAPYSPMFQKAGVDYKTGVQYLLNAQYLLQEGSMEQKTNELRRIAQQYGVNLGIVGQNNAQNEQNPIDPSVKILQDELHALKSKISQGEQRSLTEIRAKIQDEVNTFATDGNHPYFDEVADEITIFLKSGMPLDKAYEKAVYANDVTRAKEIARINTENDAKLKAKRQSEVEAAKKAKGSNVRTIDTGKTPTEAKGKLFSSEYEAEMKAIVDKHYS